MSECKKRLGIFPQKLFVFFCVDLIFFIHFVCHMQSPFPLSPDIVYTSYLYAIRFSLQDLHALFAAIQIKEIIR